MPDIYDASKEKQKTTQRVTKTPPKPYRARIDHIIKPHQRGKGHWASFLAKPSRLRFETQERKEKIILLLRRHFATNLFWMFTVLVASALPPLALMGFSFEFLPYRYLFVTVLAWYLMVFAYGFEKFLSWFFNVNIITDERIVDIDFPSILYKDISETKIDQVQDVSIRVGGFARALFNFGDVTIQTAGPTAEINFEAVPGPEQVSRVLNELIIEEEQEKLEGRAR